MECKLSFTIAVIVLLGGAVRIKAKCFTLSSRIRSSNSSKELDHLVKVGSSQGSGKTARCDGKFTTDPEARFQIKEETRNQIKMKCIQSGEYALKAINNTNKWELVFERQNCSSADGSFLFREDKLHGKVHTYSWETPSGVRMYLSCHSDKNNSALSLTGAAPVDPRIQFAKREVGRLRERCIEKCVNDKCD
ncbi:uncharacterized protein [Montipora foliosa]|uniref:uncharacterized protein n=1 Tax=Montipora foliosa TaxID=591990 RepID=UPI0035F2000A